MEPSISQPRALAPRRLDQRESIHSLNHWKSTFRNYYRCCQYYGLFLLPDTTWDNSTNRGFTWDNSTNRGFTIILSISKKSIKFKDFFEIDRIFCLLGPSLRTWKLGHRKIFLLHTNWGFQKKFDPWGIHWQNTRSFTRPDFLISSSFGQKWRKRNWHD